MEINLSEHFTYRKLIRFTIPTIVMMIFTSIYGVVDGLFVSNLVSSDAFAAVNLVLPVTMIVGTVGFMFGTGGSAIVSMSMGEGKKEQASRYFSLFIYLEVILGVILALILWGLLEPILLKMGATQELLPMCLTYGHILLVGMPAYILQSSFQSFMVVAEKPKTGLYVTVAAGVTNMVLDFVFMYFFHWGVAGAAWATNISQFVGALIPLGIFYFDKKSNIHLGKTRFEWKPVWKAMTNGSSEMVTNLSMSLVNILFNAQLMKFAGADGVAAYGIIMYVGFLFAGTYVGYAVGSAPVVSYHYGAGNIDEIKGILRKSVTMLAIIALVMTGIAEIFAEFLARIFVGYDPELTAFTTHAMRLFSLSYLISWFNIYASSFFTALNNGLVSALISFLRTLVFQVLAIMILPSFLSIDGIWLAVVFAEVLSIVVSVSMYLGNRKKYGYF